MKYCSLQHIAVRCSERANVNCCCKGSAFQKACFELILACIRGKV